MTHYFCLAEGLADFSPTTQDFYSVETESEFREVIQAACDAWETRLPEANDTRGDEFYAYEFRMPRDGENNYSQRLRIASSEDYVLDVIGMTADEYAREMGNMEDCSNDGVNKMTQDQKDFLEAIAAVDFSLATHLQERLIAGDTFDEVQASLKRAVAIVDDWRIERDI